MKVILFTAIVLMASPVMAQPAPSGVVTPAPMPDIAPQTASAGDASVVPEQIAPPATTADPAKGTPFSGVPDAAQ